MSKKRINISENVMQQIREGKVSIRPRIYFLAGSVLTFLGLVSSVIVSVFLLSLTRFILRSHGPMAQFRITEIISSFPWWAPILAIAGLVLGITLLQQYEISYKKNFVFLALTFIVSVFLAAWIIDLSGLNDIWYRQGPMRGYMRKYLREETLHPPLPQPWFFERRHMRP